jgi:two-component system LytT family response regulator
MLRTIIVEDEPLSRMYLCNLLAEGFADLEVVGTAVAEGEALALIAAQKPDLVFLDIELQTGTGIRVATQLEACDPAVIFTTALDEHATNLLRITGVPYIEKPIDADTLEQAITAARNKQNCAFYSVALGHLRIAMQHGGIPQSLLIIGDTQCYVRLDDIVSIEACGADSRLSLPDGESILTQQGLKELDSLLNQYGFFRTHMNHLVNLAHVKAVRQDYTLMPGGSKVPLSPKKAAALEAALALLPARS